MSRRTAGRPPTPIPKPRPNEKTLRCSRCDEHKGRSQFPRNKRNTERGGKGYWCYECKRAYDRRYWKEQKEGGKFQPSVEDQIRNQDPEPRSEGEIEAENRRLYAENKKSKRKCAHPGCITHIGYHQKRLCRMHKAEMLEHKIARKLEGAK